jgi:hypothetical protein
MVQQRPPAISNPPFSDATGVSHQLHPLQAL